MFSLTKTPPTQLEWRGKIYEVDFAFDNVLLFLQMQDDNELTEFEKYQQTLKLFFHKNKNIPADPDFYIKSLETISKVINFNPYGSNIDDERGVNATKQFDYVRDAGAIYASFLDQYGIDLFQQKGKMHWLVFKALFDGLNSKTYFKRILSIRNEDPNKFDDPSARSELLDAQNYYAVDGSKSDDERSKDALNSTGLSGLFGSFTEKKGG